MLLARVDGVALDARDAGGLTPLHVAIVNGATETAIALIRNGASVDVTSGGPGAGGGNWDALAHAARVGDEAVVAAVLDANRRAASNSTETETTTTPLHVAARRGHAAIVQTLLDAGADAGAVDAFGSTAAAAAAASGHHAIATLLSARGGDERANANANADADADADADAGGERRDEPRSALEWAAYEGGEANVRAAIAAADEKVRCVLCHTGSHTTASAL